MAFPETDLVIMVDTATQARVGRIYEEHTLTLGTKWLRLRLLWCGSSMR